MVAEQQKQGENASLYILVQRWSVVITVACLFVLAACMGAYSYRVFCDACGNPLGTMLPEFKPAVLFASGRGMIVPADFDCPALDTFLHSETASFDAATLPKEIAGSHIFFSSQSSFAQSHWLLFYSFGWTWLIFGISHGALQYLAALFYGLAAIALYCLFRVGMGRVFSVIGTLVVITLPPFLCIAPMLRDFSKAPFILMILALMGIVLKQRRTGIQLLRYAVLLGLVTGIGYGFRQDILVCLPPLLLVLLLAPLQGKRRILYRVGAVMLAVLLFCLAAMPTIIGVRSDSGSVSSHTLFQGLSREAEQRMGFGDASYDLLLHPYDTEVHAVINAHARLRGCEAPMDFYLSPAYGRAGRALFMEWAKLFPADLFVRGLASMDACMRLSSKALEYYTYEPFRETAIGQAMEPWYTAYNRYVESYGFLMLLVMLFVLAVKNWRYAVAILLILGWFMAYPNLLFEERHAFYLSFIIPWTALFLLEKVVHGVGHQLCCAFKRFSRRQTVPSFRGRKPLKVLLASCVLVICIMVFVWGLRIYQQRQVEKRLNNYWSAPLESVATVTETKECRALVRPEQQLPGMRESWNLRLGDVASEYLMLEFTPVPYPIPVTIRYQPGRGPDFTCQIVVPAASDDTENVRYYFPVYEMANYMPPLFALQKQRFSNTPLANLLVHHWGTNRFWGVELYEEDVSLLKGMYRITDKSRIPWLLYLRMQQGPQENSCYKRTRLEKELAAFWVNLGYDAKKNAKKVVSNYFHLLRQFPEYAPFARQAAASIPFIEDPDVRSQEWFQLARSVPQKAEAFAVQIASIADDLKESKAYEAAEEKYAMALTLSPRDKWYEVKLADCLLARNKFAAARKHYKAVLLVAPESPYSARQLDSIYDKQDKLEQAFLFWENLHEKYPESAVPALHLARAMERENRLDEALELYRQIETLHPDNSEALLRQGVIIALHQGYAKGRSMMDDALKRAPELQPELVAGLTRIAEYYTKTGAYAFAEAIYREVMELEPGDGWLQVRYGEVLMAQENYEKAGKVFLDILERAPESPYSAHKLDEVYKKMNAPEQRLAAWESLHEQYPDTYVPALHLTMALEDMGQYEKALSLLRAVHEAHPEQQEAGLRLGILIARLEDYETGRTMMKHAVQNDATLASLYAALLTTLAEYFLENKDAERAGNLYAELLDKNKEDVFLKTRLAESLVLQQRYEEALDLCRQLICKTPESSYIADLIDDIYAKKEDGLGRMLTWQALCEHLPGAMLPYIRYGIALESLGNLEEARSVYSKALGHAPENTMLQLRYGILTALLEDYKKGRATMDEAVRKSPELSQEMAAGLARIAMKAREEGEAKQAEVLYREAVGFAPEDYGYRLLLGRFLLEQGQKQEARDLFYTILVVNPESPLSARLLDQTYAQEDNEQMRLEMWDKIVASNPEAVVPQYHLGLTYEACGMRKEALQTYKKVLHLNPEYVQAQEAITRLQGIEE